MAGGDLLGGSFEEFERAAQKIAREAEASLARAQEAQRHQRLLGPTGPAGAVGGGVAEGASAEARALRTVTAELETNLRARKQYLDLLRTQQRLTSGPAGVRGGLRAFEPPPGYQRSEGGVLVPHGAAPRPPGPVIAPTAAPTTPIAATAATARTAVAHAELSRILAGEADATQRTRIEQQRAISVADAGNNELRRRGALTTEFISAAARGEASYREWGYQISATAAKFAGWTAVSIPVFAAIDGVRQIGQGAIQSASGVQLLQNYLTHVDTGKAREQFRSLASEFNLPIDQVSTAFQGMAKIFHNQDDAFAATKAALYAVKVGELDAADATKFLTGVVNGFQLQGNQLVSVLDKVNQAQNTFGVATKDTLAGAAQAAGAWHAAGGQWSSLVNLIVTGEKVTGRSGIQIATALQRSAEIVRRSPKNQQALRAFGIDPTQNIEGVYRDAFAKVQSGAVRGPDITKLATALSTPQLSSRISPILQNYKLFNQIVGDTSPEKSKNSAHRELENRLKSETEQLHRIGVELQVLGSNLLSSGLLTPLGLGLKAINELLHGFNSLLGLLDHIPDPIKPWIVSGGEFLVLMRGMQRLQAFQGISRRLGAVGGDRGIIRPDSELATRRYVRQGLGAEVKYMQEEQQRRAISARTAATEAHLAQQAAEAEALKNGSSERAVALQTRANAMRENSERLALEEEAINAQLAEAEARNVRFRQQVLGSRRTQTAQAFAQREGIGYVVPTTERPTSARPTRPGTEGARSGRQMEIPGLVAGQQEPLTGFEERTAAAEESARVERQTEQRLTGVGGRFTAAKSRIGTSARNLGATLKGIGASAAGLVGPFEIALAGAVIIPSIWDAQTKAWEAHYKLLNSLSTPPPSQQAAQQQARQAAAKARDPGQRSYAEHIYETYSSAPGISALLALSHYQSRGEKEAAAAAKTQDTIIRELETNNRAFVAGSAHHTQTAARTFITPDMVEKSLREDAEFIRGGHLTMAEIKKRTAIRLQEVARIPNITAEQQQQMGREVRSTYATAQIDHTGTDSPNFYKNVFKLTGDALKAQLQDMTDLVQSGYATAGQTRQQAADLFQNIFKASRLTDPHQRASDQGKGYAAMNQAMEGAGQQQFERAKVFARTQAERDKAWDAYVGAPARQYVTPFRRSVQYLGGQRDVVGTHLREAERNLRTLQDRTTVGNRGERGDAVSIRAAQAAIERAKRRVATLRARYGDLSDAVTKGEGVLKNAEREARLIAKQRSDQRFEETEQVRQATTQATQYEYAPGTPRAQYLLQKSHDSMVRTIRQYGRDTQQGQQAIASYRQQEEAAAQEAEDLAQSRGAIAVAQQTTPLGKARQTLSNMEQQLARFKGDPKHHKQSEINGLWAQIVEQRQSLAQEAAQEAQALNDAIYQYRESQTDDPVKAAQLEVERTARDIRFARTPVEKLQAKSAHKTAQKQARDARVQASEDDIQFQLQMGQITNDTAVAMYQHLLKTGNLTKAQRRNILLQMHQLETDMNQGSGLELNVGDIRLPTAYEIRSQLGITQRAGGVVGGDSTTNYNTITIQVKDGGDLEQVKQVIERHTSSRHKSRARARGMRS